MIIVAGILIALFVVPDAWTIPVIVGAIGLELAETALMITISRRLRPKVETDRLLGQVGTVVEPCQPTGTVRVRGELWTARCEAGAAAGERVRVRARDRLTLLVERAD
ncbi:MAG TPA: NfeD family protein [candidate division Zixibacteria bacterium]|nr:NfeD family protein [candidate division Zixibacteria bacterium]